MLPSLPWYPKVDRALASTIDASGVHRDSMRDQMHQGHEFASIHTAATDESPVSQIIKLPNSNYKVDLIAIGGQPILDTYGLEVRNLLTHHGP